MMSLRTRIGLLGAAFVGVAVLSGMPFVGGTTPAVAATTVNGGGSSFAKLEIDQWRAEVARNPFNLSINYVAQGSSFGRQQYIAGNIDFAASDIPFQPAELGPLAGTSRKDFAYVPVSAGGLGLMYNLVDTSGRPVTNLQLTRRAACRMFTEPNIQWNDPEIAATNPGVALPAEYVRPIVRSDGSGTSYVFSEYCLTVAPLVWSAFIQSRAADTSLDPQFLAGQPTSNWPQGYGHSGAALAADGVAAAVADSTGVYSITYNEAGFAKVRGFPNASLQNAAGQFVQPTEDAVSIALTYAQPVDNGQGRGITFKLNYEGSDAGAYFPSTYSYVIAQTTGFPADKGAVLAKFLCYAVTKGQRIDLTSKLGYARLSAPLVELAKNAIAKIPGAPPWEQCKVDSAAPPPAPTTLPPTATTAPPATTPGGGTQPPATTPGGGTVAATTPGGGTVASAPGAPRPTQTSIVIDPVTGNTSVVTIPVIDSGGTGTGTAGECVDPDTGLPIDCATAGVDPGTSLVTDPATGAPTVGGVVPAAAPAAQNPVVAKSDSGIAGTQIAWWLVQGATVCAIGVALAGIRKGGAA